MPINEKEIIELLKGDSALNKARQVFSSYSAMIENGMQQRVSLCPIEVRRLEFEAVLKIKEIFDAE